MTISFRKALEIAQEKYPYKMNHYEEYEKHFVFEYDDGNEYVGGDHSPIVIRKSDAAALNYTPIFFNLWPEDEDVGPVISDGTI